MKVALAWCLTYLLTGSVILSCTHKPFKPLSVAPIPSIDSDCNGQTPSFKKDIQPILKATCAKVGCHDGNSMPSDYSVYSNLVPSLYDSAVYNYVVIDRKMPQDTALGAAQFKLVKCWLNSGHPDN